MHRMFDELEAGHALGFGAASAFSPVTFFSPATQKDEPASGSSSAVEAGKTIQTLAPLLKDLFKKKKKNPKAPRQNYPQPPPRSNTTTYFVIGAVVLALGIAGFVAFKVRRK